MQQRNEEQVISDPTEELIFEDDQDEDQFQSLIEWQELAVMMETLRNDLHRMRLQEERRCSTSAIVAFISQKNLFYFGKFFVFLVEERARIPFRFVLVSGFVLGFCIYPTMSKYLSSIRFHR